MIVGFVTVVALHGVLDFVPHGYPFSPGFDIVFCLALFAVFALFTKQRNLVLLAACYIGCLFLDLVDLGPAMINKRVNLGLPAVKIFPWHWREYSGSIYDGSRQFESSLWHSLLFAASVILLVVFGRQFFWFGGSVEKQTRG